MQVFIEKMHVFIDNLIALAIAEDIGDGDHTTLACIPAEAEGKMELLIKKEGILAGVDMAIRVFQRIDPKLKVSVLLKDGTPIKKGDIAFHVQGAIRSMLQAERIVLNIMQRMSGVATQTAMYVEKLGDDYKARILDTRKTTPGMRVLDKMAVRIGGGVNHRMGLYDMILLKDNHVDFAGGIENAINKVHAYLKQTGRNMPIEVEVRTIDDLKKVLQIDGIQCIMLDNFSIPATKEAVQVVAGRCEIESSGNITFDNLLDYAECGVNFISIGALTHQVRSLDMSLKAIKN